MTAGGSLIDIDAYACIVAYAEILTKLGHVAKPVSTPNLMAAYQNRFVPGRYIY